MFSLTFYVNTAVFECLLYCANNIDVTLTNVINILNCLVYYLQTRCLIEDHFLFYYYLALTTLCKQIAL